MVIIRLTRRGVKNRPFYHVSVSDSRNARDGRFIERIGFFNPLLSSNNPNTLFINKNRLNYWLSKGAKLSNRVVKLLKIFKNNV